VLGRTVGRRTLENVVGVTPGNHQEDSYLSSFAKLQEDVEAFMMLTGLVEVLIAEMNVKGHASLACLSAPITNTQPSGPFQSKLPRSGPCQWRHASLVEPTVFPNSTPTPSSHYWYAKKACLPMRPAFEVSLPSVLSFGNQNK
jgi:hypothetical protein